MNNIKPRIYFLIETKNAQIDYESLISGLKLIGDYIDKSILKPNNILFPNTRLEFLNMIK